MQKFLIKLVGLGLSLYLVDFLMDSISFKDNLISLTIALTVCNLIIKPILKLFTLPLTILTFGLFSLIINAIILYIAFSLIMISMPAFSSIFLASILLSIINSVLNSLLISK